MAQSDDGKQTISNSFLIVLITQVGCLTLLIILASLGAGVWLDKTLGTRPLFTLVLLLAGTPLSVIVMLLVARRTIAKIKAKSIKKDNELAS